MICPFLSEAQVRSCQLAPVRKLIPQTAAAGAELCSSARFAECAAFRRLRQAPGSATVCPQLVESLMQYCSAAPVMRLVPWSEAAVSRCGSGAFHYCDLYLEMKTPPAHGGPKEIEDGELPVRRGLRYTSNHMWLDVTEDGLCHVGIDALFARLLGRVESVEFVTPPGGSGPAAGAPARSMPGAVLRAAGHDWLAVFPRPMTLTAWNLALRSDPSRLTDDPYGHGWMFAGKGVDSAGLVSGEAARRWMEDEPRRLNEFVQSRSGCAADGGVVESGLLARLPRRDAVLLFNDFLLAAEPDRVPPGGDIRGEN
ncbi:MAG: hypothetical protein ACLQBJ_02885 [Bryobacteraceae bacterium]